MNGDFRIYSPFWRILRQVTSSQTCWCSMNGSAAGGERTRWMHTKPLSLLREGQSLRTSAFGTFCPVLSIGGSGAPREPPDTEPYVPAVWESGGHYAPR